MERQNKVKKEERWKVEKKEGNYEGLKQGREMRFLGDN